MRTPCPHFALGVMLACAKRGMPQKVASVILLKAQMAMASPEELAGIRKEAALLSPLLRDDGPPAMDIEARQIRGNLIKSAKVRLSEFDAQLKRDDIPDGIRLSLAFQRNALQRDLNDVIVGS